MQTVQESKLPNKTLLVMWYELLENLRLKLIKLAIFLEKTRFIYALYGAADGLNLCYTTLKYAFDIKNNLSHITSNIAVTKDLQEWLKHTDLGIVFIMLASGIFVLISTLGNLFKDSRLDPSCFFNRWMLWFSEIWPYIRDGIKATKNAYKGWRSALSLTLIFNSGTQLLLPLGLSFGVLSLGIRLYKRKLVTRRKDLQTDNEDILKTFENYDMNKSLLEETDTVKDYKEKALKNEMPNERNKLFAIAVYGGFIDSLYLHMGFISMGPMCPTFFLITSIFCLVFLVAHIAMRIYEEDFYQKKLERSRLETLIKICNYQKQKDKEAQYTTQLQALNQDSSVRACLAGLHKGFAVFSAISSVTFLVNAILLVGWSYSLPPVGILATVSIGLAILIGFMGKELYDYRTKKSTTPTETKNESKCRDWAEVFRNLFYGFSKGIKAVDFIGNTKLNIDVIKNRISYPTDLKVWAIICAFINSAILSLWALAKGFGNNKQTMFNSPTCDIPKPELPLTCTPQ